MKNRGFYLFMLTVLVFASCEKLVEDKQRDALEQLITNGQWHVESYLEGTNQVTQEFEGFNFQFTVEGTVYGHKDSSVVAGSWSGDIENYSITSNFPNAENPLKRLNGTWKIKDSSLDYVAAEMITQQGTMILHLRKNP